MGEATYSVERPLQVTRPSERELRFTRTFDAPRELVFAAYTRSELLEQWYGPEGWPLIACENDLKVGGSYRLGWRRPNGRELHAYGTYRELTPGEHWVRTEAYQPAWTGGELVSTLRLTEQNGATTVTITSLYQSEQSRDQDAAAAEHGITQSFDRLARLLSSLRDAAR